MGFFFPFCISLIIHALCIICQQTWGFALMSVFFNVAQISFSDPYVEDVIMCIHPSPIPSSQGVSFGELFPEKSRFLFK